MNKTKLSLIAATLAVGTLAGVAAPVMAQTAYPSYQYAQDRDADEARFAPPAQRYEAPPPQRPGFVWSEGHWNWQGDRYVWQAGHWERDRTGYVYQPARWVQVGDHWELREARWVPGERYGNRPMHDRDGDGVPNRYDRYPDNPHRS